MGEAEYLREVYDASYRRLVRQLLGITGSLIEAEDVVQEAFVRAIDQAERFRRVDNPEAWLRTVAVNLSRSRWRRLRGFAKVAPRLANDQICAAEDSTDRLALLAALRALPPAQREVIALHHLADLPVHTRGPATEPTGRRSYRRRAATCSPPGTGPRSSSRPTAR